jgi:hypothetical protein
MLLTMCASGGLELTREGIMKPLVVICTTNLLSVAVSASMAPAPPRHPASAQAAPAGVSSVQDFRVSVYPLLAVAPADVRIEAIIEPSSENGSLEFTLDSGEFYRSSLVQLAGADAARVQSVQFRGVPGGAYEVLVTLMGSGGDVRAVVHRNARVVK